MNALVVLLARLSTGLFLILWAYAVHADLRGAVDLVTSLSFGFFTDETYRMALVYGAGALGLLTLLGLARALVYPLQALAVLAATGAVWKSLVDPLGIFIFSVADTNMLFFPMLGLFVASLVPLSLWEEDALAVDSAIGAWRDRDRDGDEAPSRALRQMTMAVPAAAAAPAASDHHEAAPAASDHQEAAPAAHAAPEAGGHDDHGHAAAETGHEDHDHMLAADDSHDQGTGHPAKH